jgi:hypothetical protein
LGDPNLRIGLNGIDECRVRPNDAHHEITILRMIAKGRQKLKTSTWNRKALTPQAILALLVDTVGLAGTQSIIAAVLQQTDEIEATAATLRIPLDCVISVAKGSFPTSETAPTLQ